MDVSRKEVRLLLLHEFRFGPKSNGSNTEHMHYDWWGSALLWYSETLVQAIQRRKLWTRWCAPSEKAVRSKFRSLKATYWKGTKINCTLSGRAAWVLSYCSGKTSARFGQDVEIWNLDTTWVDTTSTTEEGRRVYGTIDFSPQLQMALQPYYWRWEVGNVRQPHAQATMAGSRAKRYSNAKKWSPPKDGNVERLVGRKTRNPLGASSNW